MSSSTLAPPTNNPDAATRPRNRRLISVEDSGSATTGSSIRGTARLPDPTSPLRERSPIPSARLIVGAEDGGRSTSRKRRSPAGLGSGLLNGGSWTPNWASMQELASGWLTGTQASQVSQRRVDGRNGSRTRSSSRPTIEDIGAGILAQREADLQAVRTASILESWDGVNGGLDVMGSYKRRISDDLSRSGAGGENEIEDMLVYIHHVKPTDTFAGIVLRYGCREDALKMTNGLWSRDAVQTRKWLGLPVDACTIKGRPCEGPSEFPRPVDLLAPTPGLEDERERDSLESPAAPYDDFFSSRPKPAEETEHTKPQDDNQEWTHVRWVSLESFPEPVEIGRVSRRSHGYFPPRRKKSLHTVSSLSTPRQSIDMLSIAPIAASPGATSSAEPSSSLRDGVLGHRAMVADMAGVVGASTPKSARSRGGSVGTDPRPLWMRRPGGVGSMGKNVHAPGPEKDLLNAWAKKHFPSLNLESLPSMSVVGSEVANFGLSSDETPYIVDGPFSDSRDPGDPALENRNGTGLDRAAATVETWLRAAFAKRPGTPTLGPRQGDIGDLIELLDTHSDDGRCPPRAVSSLLRGDGGSGQTTNQSSSSAEPGAGSGEEVVRSRVSRMGSSSDKKKGD
jgi:hypothetical protein